MGMSENQIKVLREQFEKQAVTNHELSNAVTWLSLAVNSQNKLIRHLLLNDHTHVPYKPQVIRRTTEAEAHDLEEQSLIEGSKDIAKLHAARRISPVEDTFSQRYPLSADWGQKREKK